MIILILILIVLIIGFKLKIPFGKIFLWGGGFILVCMMIGALVKGYTGG